MKEENTSSDADAFMIKIKRIYDDYTVDDGYRVLVDRLWPRGISKESAHIDLWLREIGPSNELRKWFAHDIQKWKEFAVKYKEELKDNTALLELKKIASNNGVVTLLYGAKDEAHNQAVVLLSLLK